MRKIKNSGIPVEQPLAGHAGGGTAGRPEVLAGAALAGAVFFAFAFSPTIV
jgi:hypothetical protein